MDMRKRQPIGVELVKRGIVTEKDIEKALEYQREHPNRKLGDILYILDVCDPNKLIETTSQKLEEMTLVHVEVAKSSKTVVANKLTKPYKLGSCNR